MSTAADYLDGSIKHHPDWPENMMVAQRHPYEDDDDTSCSSWLGIAPGMGTVWLRHTRVESWPDAEGLTLLKADQVVPAPPTPPVPVEPVPPTE